MLEIILETFLDALKILPFLFFAFLFIELVEHKFNVKSKNFIFKSGKFGPLLGSLFGLFPNCGFSVAATNLFITRVISLGTLISIYLSTSDEMLPILISNKVDYKIILNILIIKFIVGLFFGLIIDAFFVRKNQNKEVDYNVCKEEHCDCEHGIFKSSFKHTIKTILFVLIISFFLNIVFDKFSSSFINKLFMRNSIFAPFVGSLIGLIPNCGSSIILTELFLENVISFGTCISGLLTGSGVAILVLFRQNKDFKENLVVLFTIYFIGVLIGILIELFNILI